MVVVGTTRRGEIESILDGECEDKGKVQKNQQELTQDGMGINMNEITIVLNFSVSEIYHGFSFMTQTILLISFQTQAPRR